MVHDGHFPLMLCKMDVILFLSPSALKLRAPCFRLRLIVGILFLVQGYDSVLPQPY